MPESRLRMIKEWRSVIDKAVRAVKRLYPGSEVYLFGGAAEGRLTVLSDIDLAVVFRGPGAEPEEVLARIWEEMEREGVPPYYPLEVHVLSRKELRRLKGVKVRLA